MDLCQWWAEEARGEHYAPEGAQCHSGDELEVFHRIWKLDRFTARPFFSFTVRPFFSFTARPFLSRIRSNDFFALLTEGPLVTLAE